MIETEIFLTFYEIFSDNNESWEACKAVSRDVSNKMFKKTGFFGGLWKVKNPHSLEHLKYLYNVLSKNQTVNDSNKVIL